MSIYSKRALPGAAAVCQTYHSFGWTIRFLTYLRPHCLILPTRWVALTPGSHPQDECVFTALLSANSFNFFMSLCKDKSRSQRRRLMVAGNSIEDVRPPSELDDISKRKTTRKWCVINEILHLARTNTCSDFVALVCSWPGLVGHFWHLCRPQEAPTLPQQSSCLVRPGRGLPHYNNNTSLCYIKETRFNKFCVCTCLFVRISVHVPGLDSCVCATLQITPIYNEANRYSWN